MFRGGDDDTESPAKYLTAVVSTEPADAVGVIGGQASFSITFTAVISSLFTPGWQISFDGGTTWGDLVETTGYYEGVATTTLTVKAIDNFLATRDGGNGPMFRCRLLFNGAVPSFTQGARLSVPIHTNWYAGSAGGMTDSDTAAFITVGLQMPLTVTGFTPTTYLWSNVGGEAWPILNPNAASCNFIIPVVAGVHSSRWICTLSDGLGNSVATDPLLFIYAALAPIAQVGFQVPAPAVTVDGAAMMGPPTIFVAPWSIAMQNNIRRGVTAAVTPDTPNANTSSFSLNGPDIPGTCVSAFPYFAGFNPAVTRSVGYLGNTVWGE